MCRCCAATVKPTDIFTGSDHLLWYALETAGLSVHMKAVYELDGETLICGSFDGIQDVDVRTEEDEYSQYWAMGAREDRELVWVKSPEHFSFASTYCYHGNEPNTANCYVGGALIVDFPAADKEIRAI